MNAVDNAKPNPRGERLQPGRSHRLFWHLTCLRRAMDAIPKQHILERASGLLVDYGCGNAPYRSIFEPRVSEYIGFDFGGNEFADRLLNSDGTLPIESESADFLLSSQVLEHVPDPSAYLNEAHRVLKTTGLLVLSTHGTWRYHPDPTDFWRWTCDGLRRRINESEFEIIHFQGIMGPEATALQLWQDAVLPRVPRRLKKFFTFYMQWRIRRADEKCPDSMRDKDACVYVLVAKKMQPTKDDHASR